MPSSTSGESSIFRAHPSRGTIIKAVLVGAAVLALVVYLICDVAMNGPLMSLLSNRDRLVESVQSFGPFAPLLYIVLQVIQTVVAPIPGQVVGGVGGFLFGPWGILWTTIGSMIGCWCVFMLAKRFGRPLLEKMFKKSVINKFDFILDAQGASLIIFAIFLLPGFPDDVVCYIAGLTKISVPKLMVLITLGRFPSIVMTNFIGAGVSDNLGVVLVVAAVSVVILALAVWQRDRLMSLMKRGRSDKQEIDANVKKDDQ